MTAGQTYMTDRLDPHVTHQKNKTTITYKQNEVLKKAASFLKRL